MTSTICRWIVVWPCRNRLGYNTTRGKEVEVSTTSSDTERRCYEITAQELGVSFTEGNENYLCVWTSVFLTHLVLNLEHLERHTPRKSVNMELKRKKTINKIRLTILLRSPITMFSHMLTRPLTPPNSNTKVLPSHCEKVGVKRKLIFAFHCQLTNF